ncbi:MAG TPA: response regulator [Steroidobacteraceae bacterium]|jgi:DNA-binding response OmpR family regulator
MTRPKEPFVAIVDDDARLLESLGGLVESAGCCVSLHSSAESCLEMFATQAPDCLISDIGLPGLNGIDLVRRLRGQWPGLPALLVTARDVVPLRQAAIECGAFRLLSKPFVPAEFLAALREALTA